MPTPGSQPRPANPSPSGPHPSGQNLRRSGPYPVAATNRPSGPQPLPPGARQSGPQPFVPSIRQSGPQPFTAVPDDHGASLRRSPGRWRRALLVFLLLAGGGAAAVHHYLVPLDVVAVWWQPARLSISSDPSGATLRLDGEALSGTSPTAVSVPRDRLEHVLEAIKPGYRPARLRVRYDRGVVLTAHLELSPEPPPPAPPPPDPTAARAGSPRPARSPTGR